MKIKRLLLIALLSAVLAESISAQEDWQGEGSKQMMLEGQDDLAVKKKVEHTFSLNGNLGLITSKVTTPRGTYSWQVGYGFEGSYRCVFKKGFGFALSYMYSKTGYSVIKIKEISSLLSSARRLSMLAPWVRTGVHVWSSAWAGLAIRVAIRRMAWVLRLPWEWSVGCGNMWASA